MGPIFSRSREHLGRADAAVITMRRTLLRMASDLMQGIEQELVQRPERFSTLPINVVTCEANFGALWDTHRAGMLASRAAAT